MAMRKQRVTRLGMFVRGRRFDRNPLRRATDRVETAVLALLVAAFLIGAPFAAVAAGTWIHGMARQAQLAQEASRSSVTAVVLSVSTSPAGGQMLAFQAQARWRAPDGREVIHEVPVPSGTVAGAKVQVWTDRAGDVTSAPLSDSQVAQQTTIAEVTGVVCAAAAFALAGVLALWAINKRRMADWDADWHATGPRWTTHA